MKEQNFHRIVRLQARNVKRIKAIDVTPDGTGVTIVAGNNGEGKTSLLDSIMWALAGKDAVDKDPIRRGQQKAEVTVECDGFTVKRTITPTKQTLELKDANGEKIGQPQTWLDNILGRLTFDPLEFSKMKGRIRVATLLELIPGLETKLDEIATHRATLYEDRKGVNHDARNYQAQLEEMDTPEDDWPTETVSTTDLLKEKNFRQATLNGNNAKREELKISRGNIEQVDGHIETVKEKILELEVELNLAEAKKRELLAFMARLQEGVDMLTDPDIAEIDAQIEAAEGINTKVTHAAAYRRIKSMHTEAENKAGILTDEITALEKNKEEILEQAEFPIKGLAFGDGEVLFGGILWDQLSSSEQVKVSVAMAMAMNPALRVIRITDGSLLDNKSLDVIREMARQRDYQVWIECVGDRADATVVIEDGQAKAKAATS
jgi:DNA repair exonuclease SbcCD ATPase subunit